MDWHNKTAQETLDELGTDAAAGLSSGMAAERLEKWGRNLLEEKKGEPVVLKLLKQFTDFMILVLFGAAAVSWALGEWVDAAAIIAIVLLNGVIGFIQEERAGRVVASLKKISAPFAKCLRDSGLRPIPASRLVPGDVIIIESGDTVPADCRVIESSMLKVSEAALTGESLPVEKSTGRLQGEISLAERTNMVYLGTSVVYGRARAAVVSTGMTTEMGKIARMLQEAGPEPTPLQKRLEKFGKSLVYAAGLICALVFALGVLRGEDTLEMFLTAITLAVAAIPEGLPAVVTIVLALGVQRMVKRHALVRKLPSVETLGAASVIATDKTGTLTSNRMTLKEIILPDKTVTTGQGFPASPDFFADGKKTEAAHDGSLRAAFRAAVLCSTSELLSDGSVTGDPTEGALLVAASKAGLGAATLGEGLEFGSEVPFDPERKMMSAVYRRADGSCEVFTKGAPERVLTLCTTIMKNGVRAALTAEERGRILDGNNAMSGRALRVLALACREAGPGLDTADPAAVEKDLTFLALAGMMDPPRPEVYGAVKRAKEAGLTPIMITGDNRLTAVAIARELGIMSGSDMAVTGAELDAMDEAEFARLLPGIKVFARVDPAHKSRIVRAWKAKGVVIAMTGDGVNDAPALKEADIGIAMGVTGTDAAREASDMVLTDDNFASIISAVEEGRGIFDNIRRAVHYLLSCNIGEILVLLAASLLYMPLPLLPVQILWINLVTDGLPALGLSMEPIDPGVMKRPPRAKAEGIVTGAIMRVMLLQGAFLAAFTLVAYAFALYWLRLGLDEARTIAFMVLVLSQLFHAYNCRSARRSVLSIGLASNRVLLVSVVLIIFTQAVLDYVPGLRLIFSIAELSPWDWALVAAFSVQPLLWMEAVKVFFRD